MTTPLNDLNVRIGHEQILQSFDVPVKTHLPSVTVCPLCEQEALYIYVSPGAGGRWYNCRVCHFRGDSIELYQAGHKLQDIPSAVRELSSKQILPMTKSELTTDLIKDYIRKHVDQRSLVNMFFEYTQEQLASPTQQLLHLLQDEFLWHGYSNDFQKLMGRFIGGATKKDALEHGLDVPKNFYHFLVMPFYDVPGRISSFLMVSNRGSTRISAAYEDSDENEEGLMMLDTVGLADPVVYAVRDPIFALHLQRKNFVSEQTPIPIVVYGTNTDKAWESIRANRLVFWEETQNFTMFDQSKKHARSHIAKRPEFANMFDYLRVMTLPQIMRTLYETSVPWSEAIKNYILTHEEYGEVCDTIQHLELSAYEMNKIYNLCSFTEREHMKQVLGEKPSEQHVYVNNMKVVESNGALYIERKNHRELGCNAVIKIEKAVHASDSGVDTYEGQISCDGKVMEFKDEIDGIEARPSSWLRKKMMEGGLGVPIIQNRLKPYLVDIAKQFYPIEYTKGYGRVGWYPDEQAFIFPNFSVRDGKIDSAVRALVSSDLGIPASSLTIEATSQGDWDDALEYSNENAVLWAALACFMTNLLAPVLGFDVTSVGLIGKAGSLSSVIGKHVASELGMLTFNTEKRKSNHVWGNVETATELHGYPVWLDVPAHNHKFHVSLNSSTHTNVMMPLPEWVLATLAVGDGWVFIDGNSVCAQRRQFPRLTGVMRYLSWLQSTSFKLPPATSPQQSVLMSLEEWADDELHAIDLEIFKKASKLIQTPDLFGLDTRLLRLILWLQEDRRLGTSKREVYNEFKERNIVTKDILIIDEAAERVYIHEEPFVKAFKSLPSFDYDAAIQQLAAETSKNGFESNETGFVLNLEYWLGVALKWRRGKI